MIGCGEHEHYSIKIFQSLVVEEALECRDSTCKVGSIPASGASQSAGMIGEYMGMSKLVAFLDVVEASGIQTVP